MIELSSHSKCCRTELDRARHEWDRGLRAIASCKRKGKDPSAGVIAFAAKWERRLRELEAASFPGRK